MKEIPDIDDLRERHATVIDEQAQRIRRHVDYVLERITIGRPDTVGAYTEDMAASCQKILAAVTALGTITEAEKALGKGSC